MALVECAGSDRRETATLLLAMAREKGMDTRVVRSVYNGYEVPDELLGIEDRAVLSAPEIEEPEARPGTDTPRRRGRPPGSKNTPKPLLVDSDEEV